MIVRYYEDWIEGRVYEDYTWVPVDRPSTEGISPEVLYVLDELVSEINKLGEELVELKNEAESGR